MLSTGLLALSIGVVGFGAGLATQGVDAASDNGKPPLDRPPLIEELDREVTMLDNGVQIKITSDEASEVEKIQNFHDGQTPKGPHADDINVDVELLDNGVLLTITSEDEDAVEKIQERAENPKPHFRGGEHHCEPKEEPEDEA